MCPPVPDISGELRTVSRRRRSTVAGISIAIGRYTYGRAMVDLPDGVTLLFDVGTRYPKRLSQERNNILECISPALDSPLG